MGCNCKNKDVKFRKNNKSFFSFLIKSLLFILVIAASPIITLAVIGIVFYHIFIKDIKLSLNKDNDLDTSNLEIIKNE